MREYYDGLTTHSGGKSDTAGDGAPGRSTLTGRFVDRSDKAPAADGAAPMPQGTYLIAHDIEGALDSVHEAIGRAEQPRLDGIDHAKAQVGKKDGPDLITRFFTSVFEMTLGVVAGQLGEGLADKVVDKKESGLLHELTKTLFEGAIETSAKNAAEKLNEPDEEGGENDEGLDPIELFMRGQRYAVMDQTTSSLRRFNLGLRPILRAILQARPDLAAKLASDTEAVAAETSARRQEEATVQAWIRYLALASRGRDAKTGATAMRAQVSDPAVEVGHDPGVLYLRVALQDLDNEKEPSSILAATLNGVNEDVRLRVAKERLRDLRIPKVFDCGDFRIHQDESGHLQLFGDGTWLAKRSYWGTGGEGPAIDVGGVPRAQLEHGAHLLVDRDLGGQHVAESFGGLRMMGGKQTPDF